MHSFETLHSPGDCPADIPIHIPILVGDEDCKDPKKAGKKYLSFSSPVKPVVQPSTKEDHLRRRSVVSKDFTGIPNMLGLQGLNKSKKMLYLLIKLIL